MKQVLIIQRKKKQSQKYHGSSRFAARRQKNNIRKLSDDLESSVSVTEVSEGSVIIDIELGDLERHRTFVIQNPNINSSPILSD